MTDFPKKHTTMNPQWRPNTKAVRAGVNRAYQETSEAMILTSGYAYDSAEQAAARFAGEDDGYIYSRFSNPTVEMFETRLAAMEGAAHCRATSTGMAAVTASILCQLSAGDHMVSARALFGSCRYVADTLCSRFGIDTTFVDGCDLDAWRAALKPETKLLFLESPSNPGLEIVDIAAIADIAHAHGARLLVDNVFATPILQQPFTLGADIVVYSATKHIDGQGRVLGGAVLSNDEAYIQDQLQPFLRNTGPALSPFNAWVLVNSLETLGLRVEAMTANATILAQRLDEHASPDFGVIYPYLPNHPQYDIAIKQMSGGGSLITLEFGRTAPTAIEENQAAAFRFLNALDLFDISNNLGDSKSLATHPRTTTHYRLSEEDRREQGVTAGLVRLSIGLEDHEDLWNDIRSGLSAAWGE